MDLGCQEGYRRVNEVIEIDMGIRMAGNDFRYGWKSDDNFCILVIESFRLFQRRFFTDNLGNAPRLKMTEPTISSCLDGPDA